MKLKITKQKTFALLMITLSFMTLTQSASSAKTSGVDLAVQTIKFDHTAETDEMVRFAVLVKNKGTEATESICIRVEFGNGFVSEGVGPMVIEPGETRVFTRGATYPGSGRFVVTATVFTPGDVNPRNNIKTGVIKIV